MRPLRGFDRIRIINLPSRVDRRREMLGELRRIELADDPRVSFADGVIVEEKAPWNLAKDPARSAELDRLLATLVVALQHTALLLIDIQDSFKARSYWRRRGNLAWVIANAAPNNVLKMNVRTASDGKEYTITAQLP